MNMILICDDAIEAEILTHAMTRIDLDTVWAESVNEAMRVHETQPADLILLAVRGDLHAAVTHVYRAAAVPLLLIIDNLTEDEQVALVDAGNAILIRRPYSVRLLMSQVPVFLRQSAGIPRTVLLPLQEDAVRLDPASCSVTVAGHPPRALTKLEFNLLYVLMRHAGQVLPTERLIEQVWSYDHGDPQMLRTLVWRVRKKLAPRGDRPGPLTSVRGVGYRFERQTLG